jgi:hypothetical protein
MSDMSVGVKLILQSISTTSSGVLGNVRTESIRGALLPSVKVVILIDSRNAGVEVESTWSTEATIVAERTGS